MGAGLLVSADSKMFLASILSTSDFSIYRVFGPLWYGAQYAGAVSGLRSLVQCFAVLMRTIPHGLDF